MSRRRAARPILDARTHVTVRACADVPAVRGLFVSSAVPKGSLVARMDRPRPPDAALVRRIARGAAGHDAAVQRADGTWVTSAGFGPVGRDGAFARAPRWYRMNHSDRPTAKPVAEGDGIAWYALRDLQRGEPVSWDYGQRDPRWPRGAFCTHPVRG